APGKHAEDVRIGQLSGKNASSLPDGALVREINVIARQGAIARRGNGCRLPALWLSETKGRGEETKNPRDLEQSQHKGPRLLGALRLGNLILVILVTVTGSYRRIS